jgi:hypothetical protein
MAGAVNLERPSCLVDLANDRARLLKRRSACCKIEGIGADSSDAERRRHTMVASAESGV